MSDLGNKAIMAKNLRRLMADAGIDRNTLCNALGFKYSTVSEWLNATAYPRIDKIELMARYFGVTKADLVEEEQKPPEALSDERFAELFNDLDARDQDTVLRLMQSMIDARSER